MKSSKVELQRIRTLANGDSQNVQVISLKGEPGGPIVHIQSSVHGAEIQGNAVIFELLKILKNNPFKGEIVFVPCANPLGLNYKSGTFTQGRFNPVTGDNWNRNYIDICNLPIEETNLDLPGFSKKVIDQGLSIDEIKRQFKILLKESYNQYWTNFLKKKGPSDNKALNIFLQKLASHADIVLDLHTGPQATRYLYAGEFEKQSAKHFLTQFSLIIPNEFAGAMDEACFMPWLNLEENLRKKVKTYH